MIQLPNFEAESDRIESYSQYVPEPTLAVDHSFHVPLSEIKQLQEEET